MRMNVWITRTEPGATTLSKAVEAAGFGVLKAPVLAILPLPFAAPQGQFDIALFLSAHGARLAASRIGRCFDQAFAVGRQTAAALGKAGVSTRTANVASSEGLLDSLPDVKGLRILLVAGVGGRNLIAPALAERGAQVQRLVVYRRAPLAPTVNPKQIDAIVVSSGDGFRQAVRVWFASNGAPDAPMLAPSGRVAALGAQLGASRVLRCEDAGADAVVAALRRMAGMDG